MTNDAMHMHHTRHMKRLPAAERRAVLLEQCAQQRQEMRSLLAPAGESGSLFGSLKLPLIIAGAVIGLLATRSGRVPSFITAGFGLWKLAGKALPMLRLLRRWSRTPPRTDVASGI